MSNVQAYDYIRSALFGHYAEESLRSSTSAAHRKDTSLQGHGPEVTTVGSHLHP